MPGPGSGALTAMLALLLMVMPAIVLLVACLNLADLLLARGHVRRQELAIRSSLGGGRWRLTRQLLTEGLLLALAGGAVGLLLSTWATDALLASLRPVLPVALSLPELDLDWRVLVGTVGFSLVASAGLRCLAGLVVDRSRGRDRSQAARRRRRTPPRQRQDRQCPGDRPGRALAAPARSRWTVPDERDLGGNGRPGFRLDGGLVVEVDSSLAGYDETRGRQAHLALVDRLRTVPGVEAVTIGSSLPFTSFGDSRNVAPAGAADAQAKAVDAVFSVVGRDYARVLGLPMLAGRDFTDAELAPGSGAGRDHRRSRSRSGCGRERAHSDG